MLKSVDVSHVWTFIGVKNGAEVGFWMAGQPYGSVVCFNAHPVPMRAIENPELAPVQATVREVKWIGWPNNDLVAHVWVKNLAGYGTVYMYLARTV